MTKLMQHLRSAALRLGKGAERTDEQLLACFVSHRENEALEVLMRRHGPMVWGVCCRVLRHHQDAEDAFQATFLVLVRKAASIQPRTQVGNWLYGVAHRTALKARAVRAKREVRERNVAGVLEPATPEQAHSNDLRALLDQELSRQPEKYRAVLVLCDLEGRTKREVARQLDLPEGTVASRLARGRAMLGKRLARHDLALSGTALTAMSCPTTTSACVPPTVLSATIKAATAVATGEAAAGGLISAKVAALTEEVLKAMLLTRIRTLTALLVVVLGMIAFGGGLLYRQMAGGQPTEANGTDVPASQYDEKLTVAEETKVLTPDEAAEKRSNQEATVDFRVGRVGLLEFPGFVPQGQPVPLRHLELESKDLLKSRGRFRVILTGRAVEQLDRIGMLPPSELTEDFRKLTEHFRDKVVRVTGRLEPVEPAEKGTDYRVVVKDLDQIRVVKLQEERE